MKNGVLGVPEVTGMDVAIREKEEGIR